MNIWSHDCPHLNGQRMPLDRQIKDNDYWVYSIVLLRQVGYRILEGGII